jgi:hypothetical protein
MAPIQIIDKYNLVISLLITVGWQMLGFAIAWTFKVGAGVYAAGRAALMLV